MRPKWLLAASAAIVLTFAAALLLQRKSSAPPDLSPRPAGGFTFQLTGKIQPQSIVNVPAPVDGTLTEIVVSVGQEVSAGQLLARMESGALAARRALEREESAKIAAKVRELESALDTARLEASRSQAAAARAGAAFDSAEKEYLRQKELMAAGAAPRLVFEKSERDCSAARADRDSLAALAREAVDRSGLLTRQLAAARAKLPDTAAAEPDNALAEVHSPVDGVVVSSAAKTGAMVKAETALVQIAVNLAALDVALYPDKKILARLRTGQPAVVRVAEAGDIAIPGAVRAIGDDGALVGFQSPSPAVKPGLSAIVRMTMSSPN